MVELGVKGRDKVTGFTGVVTGRCEYLTGCNQVLLVPAVDKDGKLPDGHWFDVQRIEVIGHGVKVENDNTPGHDIAPPRRV